MKQEKLLKTLIKELLKLDELHQEYQDSDTHYVIDSQKDGNKLIITVEIKDNKDKKEFEGWCESLPDDVFEEAITKMKQVYEKEGLDFTDEYTKGDSYKGVINDFKQIVKESLEDRINKVNELLKFIY